MFVKLCLRCLILNVLKWLYAILADSQNLQQPATLAETYLQISLIQ